jgi:hypothetical protein
LDFENEIEPTIHFNKAQTETQPKLQELNCLCNVSMRIINEFVKQAEERIDLLNKNNEEKVKTFREEDFD